MIYLSPQAISEIKRKQLSLRLENVWFRLAVKSGGCSGLFYDMCFEKAVTGGDVTFNCNGIQVIVDEQTLNYINGLKLDYSEDLMGGGFRFDNPLALGSCGCGNSFSVTSSEQAVISC